ncbi:hypothetical protein ACGFZS_38785 [Streptomyces sp. NPDC048288]|uniref:hypothetical protein n=1 Tax=Streptomyces sp. NPDC048288 TaxID=3365529 RepID=UPI00371DD0D3
MGDVPEPEQSPHPTRSRAHILLAALGRTAPALSLSQTDCAALAPLLAEWPLLRKRLTDKIPPEPVRPPARPPLRILECAKCGVPGRPEALPGGLCGACRGERAPGSPSTPLSPSEVRSRVSEIRGAMNERRERTPA